MPVKIPNHLPVRETLEKENIFVMDEDRALHQDIRPIRICILNLMPLKEQTELQILRELSNTPLQIDVTFMKTSTHESTHTSKSHLDTFYETFEELRARRFDGMIITGAPVELKEFEEIDYWEELEQIFSWCNTHVTSTIYLCWGAQAAMYYYYGLPKRLLPGGKKLFGIYENTVYNRKTPLVRGFDWLLGGIFGIARGLVVVVLVLCLLPSLVQIVSPEFADNLRTGSSLYSFVTQMDFLNVNNLVTSLIGG